MEANGASKSILTAELKGLATMQHSQSCCSIQRVLIISLVCGLCTTCSAYPWCEETFIESMRGAPIGTLWLGGAVAAHFWLLSL